MITTNTTGAAISAGFAAAIASGIVDCDCKLYCNGVEVDGTLKGMSLTLGSTADAGGATDDFTIGTVYSNAAVMDIYDLNTLVLGKQVEIRIGVYVSGAYEYVRVATLTVTQCKTVAGISHLELAGSAAYSMQDVALAAMANASPQDVADAITLASGVTVTVDGGFTDDSVSISIDAGTSCRDALATVCKRLGGYAWEDGAGSVTVQPFDNTPTWTAPADNMTAFPNLTDTTYEVDGLTVISGQDSYIFGTGRVQVEDDGATLSDATIAWGNVGGYEFTAGVLQFGVLDPRVQPCDVASVTFDGNTYTVPCTGIEATYDGGYFGTVSASGLTTEAEAAKPRGELRDIATQAATAAEEAKAVAEATGQHFWADVDGAHVTEITQDDWLAEAAKPNPFSDVSDQKPYHNLLMNSLGILLRSALNNLVSITRSAIAFFDGGGNDAENVVASFGAAGAQVGYSDTFHTEISAEGTRFYGYSGEQVAEITTNGVTGYQTVTDELFPSSFKLGSQEFYTRGMTPANNFTVGNIVIYYDVLGPLGRSNGTVTVTALPYQSATLSSCLVLAVSQTADGSGFEVTAQNVSNQQITVGVVRVTHHFAGTGATYTFGSRDSTDGNGSRTFVAGESLSAVQDNQAVFGKYNVPDTGNSYALIVGNGSDSANQSNAFAVSWTGNAEFASWGGNNQAFFRNASNMNAGTLGISYGGTGQSGVTNDNTITDVITASSGITISGASYRKWGKFVQLNVDFKRSSAIANNTNVTVGTLTTGHRPVAIASGGNGSSIIAYCNSSGTLSVRNISGSQIAANTTINVSICFMIS